MSRRKKTGPIEVPSSLGHITQEEAISLEAHLAKPEEYPTHIFSGVIRRWNAIQERASLGSALHAGERKYADTPPWLEASQRVYNSIRLTQKALKRNDDRLPIDMTATPVHSSRGMSAKSPSAYGSGTVYAQATDSQIRALVPEEKLHGVRFGSREHFIGFYRAHETKVRMPLLYSSSGVIQKPTDEYGYDEFGVIVAHQEYRDRKKRDVGVQDAHHVLRRQDVHSEMMVVLLDIVKDVEVHSKAA